ncbi:hypothetical protein ACIP5Y_23630 [Nocardia sp. NPDC088792]|uniref:hypothetical protein n=1 Tax=Nocardia sp. NPDC088792 TaxID=3364332 RepID=UPI003810DCFC
MRTGHRRPSARFAPWIGFGLVPAITASTLIAVAGTALADPDDVTQVDPADRTEQVLEVTDGVQVSKVTWHDPLPASAGPHPDACDYIGFYRFKPVDGPDNAVDADSVVSLLPGLYGNAGDFYRQSINVVREMERRGKKTEYWSTARRTECVKDNTGMQAAADAGDEQIAWDYYYKGREVNGRKFAGFGSWLDNRVLADIGLAQELNDWHFINDHEMPSHAMRQQKLFLASHSLGGPVTALYLSTDFGPAATQQDNTFGDRYAGYNDCAGWFAYDGPIIPFNTKVLTNLIPGLQQLGDALAGPVGNLSDAIFKMGLLPGSANVTSELSFSYYLRMLNVFGLAARLHPDEPSKLLAQMPENPQANLLENLAGSIARRVLFAKDYQDFFTGQPDVRTFHMTNMAALGALINNNSLPTWLNYGMGSLDGGPVAEKTFPLPGSIFGWLPAQISPLVVNTLTVVPREAPTDPSKFYTWRDYDKVGEPYEYPQTDLLGQPIAKPEYSVTAAKDAAWALGSPDYDFTEYYYSLKSLVDMAFGYSGTAGSGMRTWHTDFGGKRPNAAVLTRDGFGIFKVGFDLVDLVPGVKGLQDLIAKDVMPANSAVAEGYSHMDIGNAAEKQNNGKPEIATMMISNLMENTLDGDGYKIYTPYSFGR